MTGLLFFRKAKLNKLLLLVMFCKILEATAFLYTTW